MSVHNQFIRRSSLTIGNNAEQLDLSALHFTFSIKQADLETFQAAHIRVYNVSQDTLKAIKTKEYTKVVLQAGYEDAGNYGVIFDGDLIQGRVGRDNATDTYLDIIAGVGYQSSQTVYNGTIAAGSTAQDALKAVTGAMGIELKPYNFNPTQKLPRGKSIYGMARDELHRQAATAGFSYFYDKKGNISFVPLESAIPGTATIINADTGMVGWPELTQQGIKVRTLLNPLLDVASVFQINNASIQLPSAAPRYDWLINAYALPNIQDDGLYRIYVIEHRGDTRGNDWYSDIIGLAQNGDTGITSLSQNGQF